MDDPPDRVGLLLDQMRSPAGDCLALGSWGAEGPQERTEERLPSLSIPCRAREAAGQIIGEEVIHQSLS